ncbi:MAG: o-succinylbenzoate synthase [Acidimicrobiales bacterium]
MNLHAIELRRVRLPLVSPFRSALGTESAREALLVRVDSDEGEGWGECVAGSDPLYCSEYVDSAWLTLRRYLGPRLLGAKDLSGSDVQPLLHEFKGHRMAKAAVEMAVLDAQLRAAGVSLSTFLGGVARTVTPGVAVGIMSSVAELLDSVAECLDAGYRRVKLKIQPGWDLAPVEAVRDRFGGDLMVQVDANAAYRRADIGHLAQLDQYRLLLIEQPLAEDDLVGHAQLARRIVTPVCLDESIVSAQSADGAISMGACSVVNIKAGRVGGYLEARAVHDLCVSKGVPVWCGGMLETGLGRAANLALASLPGFTLPGDISATDRYFRQDITPPFLLHDGAIEVPTGPGLGVEVLIPVLDALTTQSETVTGAER